MARATVTRTLRVLASAAELAGAAIAAAQASASLKVGAGLAGAAAAGAAATGALTTGGGGGSVLAGLIENLAAGSYVQLPVTWSDFDAGGAGGSDGGFWRVPDAVDPDVNESILTYANKGVWDPTGKRAFFLGGGYGQARLIWYDEAADEWGHDDPALVGEIIHAWDHNALDVSRRLLYARNHPGSACFKADLSSLPPTWSSIPAMAASGETDGWEYFPEADALICADSENSSTRRVMRYRPSPTNAWDEWQTVAALLGRLQGVAVYDPVRGCVYFGGGRESESTAFDGWFRLASDGTVTQLANITPSGLVNIGGSSGSNVCCDPVTGNVLVRDRVSGAMYEFDPDAGATGTWSSVSTSGGSFIPASSATASICIPIPADGADRLNGVVMYIAAASSQADTVVVGLYRHA